jgi:hypothetical protein
MEPPKIMLPALFVLHPKTLGFGKQILIMFWGCVNSFHL